MDIFKWFVVSVMEKLFIFHFWSGFMAATDDMYQNLY